MTDFVEPLESRLFFSVSAATLAADKAALIADAARLKSDVSTIISDSTIATKAIAADFKGLSKSDQTLLKTLVTVENKAKAAYLKDQGALASPSNSLASKAIALGDSLLKNANVKTLAAESKDIAALSSVATVPLATLEAQLSGTLVNDARAAILSALAGDSTIEAAVTAEQTTIDALRSEISADAVQFQTDIGTLATDLTSVHTQTGTFPSTVSTYSGTATATSGKHKGQTVAAMLTIASEDANGNLTATVSDITSGLGDSLVGTVSLNGVVTLKSAPRTGSVKITGIFSDGTISGKVSFPGAAGTFSVSEVTG